MRAFCLLGVLIVAKGLALAGQPIALSIWAAIAYFSPDLLVAGIAAGLDLVARRHRAGWIVYGIAVLWIAVNVPIAVLLGSPLTGPMIRAARGPLTDSVMPYVTTTNILRFVVCVAAGVLLPTGLARLTARGFRFAFYILHFELRAAPVLLTTALIVAVLAPVAARRVDTAGRDRNAFTALLPLRLPSVSAAGGVPADWRVSPYRGPEGTDLRPYRGSARGMNVLMVALESTAAQYLRPYGAAEDPMPNLTTLAARAVLVENAYAVYPESIKGLFATLCSRYPAFNTPAETYTAVPCASIAQTLRGAGYTTGLFHSGRFGYLGMEAMLQQKGFDVLEDAGAIGGNVRSSFGVDEPATVDRLLAWLDSLGPDRPFFAAYLPIAGHHPYATPEPGPFRSGDGLAQYRNALHYADAALGRLLDGLRARRLSDRTLVVIFGDHGEAFEQHPGNIGHTLFIHDENVRVPYLMAIPGVTTGPRRVPAVASLIDTAPTILDLLGLPAAPDHEGTSLLQSGPRMAFFFTDYALGWLGLRDGCWKFVLEAGSGRSKLFDVCRDPNETTDRSASAPDRARTYAERLRMGLTLLVRR